MRCPLSSYDSGMADGVTAEPCELNIKLLTQALPEVQRDPELGDTVGVSGTPSVIIGTLGLEGLSYGTVAAAINKQLAQQE